MISTDLKPIETRNPFNSEKLVSYDQHTDQEVEDILSKSEKGFKSWRKTSFSERAEMFKKVASDLKSNKREYAELMTREMGKPVKQAISEVEKCAWVSEFYAENAEAFLEDKIIETDAQKSYVSYEPQGTVLAVMPWNYPMWQVFRFAVPTLMAGNTGLLKHASNVTGTALLIEEVFHKCGIPKSAFRTLKVSSDRMDNIVADNRIKAVTLTGSEGAGSAVASVAGENIKTSLLELGGSNAFVVLADADLDKAVEDAVFGRYQNTGQSCIAAKRLMIAEDIYDPFMQKFEAQVKDLQSGDPMDEEAFIGPLANSGFAEDLDEQVKKSIEAGAELRMGGQRGGAHYSPTILEDVKPGMPAFDEETFGPVAACMKFKNFNEAIDLVNRSKFGLGASVYTSDVVAILEDSKRIEDGAVFFNSFVKSDPRLAFGGTKKSGYGRELAREGILAFVNKKTTYIA